MKMTEEQERIAGLFAAQRAKFEGFVRRKAGDISLMDVEDVIADVFFNLFNQADIAGRVENLTAYVYRSLANKIADNRRRQKPGIPLDYAGQQDETPLSERLPDPSASIEKHLERKDVQERLYEALGRLEPRQRAVWIATEIEGRTFKELSRSWREPIGTLLSRKSRASRALQAMLIDLMET